MVSLLLAMWYNGVTGIINYYLPNRGPFISIFLMTIPIFIFLTDDGRLNELYASSNIQYPILASTQDIQKQHFQNVKDEE